MRILMPERERGLISAVHLATKKLASTTSVEETLREVLQICVEAVDAFGGTIYIHDADAKKLIFRHVLPEDVKDKLPREIPDDFGIAGEVFQTRTPKITQIREGDPRGERARIEEQSEVRVSTMLTAPLTAADLDPLGVVQLVNKRSGAFDDNDLAVIETVSAVSALAYINMILSEQSSRAASLIGMGQVGHDIVNLAIGVQGNFGALDMIVDDMAANPDAPDAVKAYCDQICEAVDGLKESIDNILGYSEIINKLSMGAKLVPEKRPGTIASVIQKAAAFQEAKARSKHNVSVKCHIMDDGLQTMFDKHYINRIVQNLVGNAVKAAAEAPKSLYEDERGPVCGEVTVTYSRNGEWHVISVSDTGPGMTEETKRRILSGKAASGWSKSGGTGWGTRTVLELTAALSGRLEIDTKLGLGSEFRVYLPVQLAPAPATSDVYIGER